MLDRFDSIQYFPNTEVESDADGLAILGILIQRLKWKKMAATRYRGSSGKRYFSLSGEILQRPYPFPYLEEEELPDLWF